MKYEKLLTLLIVLTIAVTPIPKEIRAQEAEPLVTLHALADSGDESMLAVDNAIKEELAKIGIQMEIHMLDSSTIIARTMASTEVLTYDEGGYDLYLQNYFWSPAEYTWFIGGFAGTGIVPLGFNYMGSKDGVADDYLYKAMSTYDSETRKEYFYAWQQEFYEDMLAVMIYYPKQAAMDNGQIKNYDPILYNADIEEWLVEGKTYEDDVVVRQGSMYDAHCLNPFFLQWGYQFLNPMYRGLYKVVKTADGTYGYAPDMADSYEISEDGLSITFHLRKDVKWSDGQPFTAADVEMSYEGFITSGSVDFASVDSVEVKDDYTVILNLNAPTPNILDLVGYVSNYFILPKHVLGNIPPEDWATDETNTVKPTPGTGPMKFVNWVKDQYMEFEANPYFYGKKPLVDRLIINVIPDVSVGFASLEGKKVDMLYSGYASAAPGEVKRLEGVSGLHIEPVDAIYHTFLALNWEHPFLANKYVRHAIAHAIPYEHIVNDLMYGLATQANSPIHPRTWAWNPNVPYVDYDLDKAQEYLAKAGYVWPPKEVKAPMADLALYIAGSLIVGVVIGAAVGFVVFRRKQPGEQPEK